MRQQKPVKQLELPLEVLYEDQTLAIVYKPAGIVVSGNQFRTLENALPYNLQMSAHADALLVPEPIHRLDYPTSGVLLVGKTHQAVIALNQLFERKDIQKVYHAVTIGQMPSTGSLNEPIDDKPSYTTYQVLQSVPSPKYNCLNLVELRPQTGRKHQLRIHLANLGNPIFGDKDYGQEGLILQGKGLYLHASSLTFQHPFTKETISVHKDLPKKFRKLFPVDEVI